MRRSSSSNVLTNSGSLALHQIPLVGDDDDAAAGAIGLAADRRVLIGGALDGVDQQRDDVRVGDRFLRERRR